MKFLRPDKVCRYLTDITPELVRAMHCNAVAIDADNTSSFDLTTEPLPGTEDWVRGMKAAGVPVVLLSNAKTERAKVLADRYDIPVIGMAMKPLRQGYLRAAWKTRTAPGRLLVAGDQLFTDILGANRSGCRTIWVQPYEADRRGGSFLLKRKLERAFSSRWKGPME